MSGVEVDTSVEIVCFCDGSCIGQNANKNSVRRSSYAVMFPDHPEFDDSSEIVAPAHTNNRAEFIALIRCLEIAEAKIDASMRRVLHVYSDSMLLINTVEKWMYTWERQDWVKPDGKPVMNLDLVRRLFDLRSRRRVVLTHVKAHTRRVDWASQWNAKVDKIAQDLTH